MTHAEHPERNALIAKPELEAILRVQSKGAPYGDGDKRGHERALRLRAQVDTSDYPG